MRMRMRIRIQLFYFDVDLNPDPIFYFDADPDLDPHQRYANLQPSGLKTILGSTRLQEEPPWLHCEPPPGSRKSLHGSIVSLSRAQGKSAMASAAPELPLMRIRGPLM
jgi:hypothetical protein